MKLAISLALSAFAVLSSTNLTAEPTLQAIPVADFGRLFEMIRPQPGESPWREVDWLTDVTEARRRSVAEDKPLVIFTAADGSPLGRT
jgi:hypothetical protein